MIASTCKLLSCIFLLLSWFSLFPIIGGATVGRTGDNITAPGRSYSTKGQGSGGLRVINRYGPASNNPRMIHHPHRVPGQGSKSTLDPASGPGVYLVKVGFGSGNSEFPLIFDTGSQITWIKCQPCSGECFDPSESSTFSNKSCNPPSITYNAYYKDGTYSKGYYGCDTITLNSPGPRPNMYQNFLFGCGDEKRSNFSDAAGLLALGKGGSAADMFGNVFCICLPVRPDSEGYLFFGDEAQSKCQSIKKSLPFTSDDGGLFYVNLIGISIGGKLLSVSSYSVSMPRTIIDTGTVVTHLPASVYSDLRREFKKSMSSYHEAPSQGVLDTCYDLGGGVHAGLTTPTILLRFKGSKGITLSRETVLMRSDNPDVFCLAFAQNSGDDDPIIIGSYQLRGLNLLFNNQKMTIGYGQGGC